MSLINPKALIHCYSFYVHFENIELKMSMVKRRIYPKGFYLKKKSQKLYENILVLVTETYLNGGIINYVQQFASNYRKHN